MEVALPSGWMYDYSVFQYPISLGERHLEVTLLPEYELGDCYVKVGKEINVSQYRTINLVYDTAKTVGNSITTSAPAFIACMARVYLSKTAPSPR